MRGALLVALLCFAGTAEAQSFSRLGPGPAAAGAAFTGGPVADATSFASVVTFDAQIDVKVEIVNSSASGGCTVSSGDVCIKDGLTIDGDIIDSRASSPVTVADVDGLAVTAGDITLTTTNDLTCTVANGCNVGSSGVRFNTIFASDLLSNRISAQGVTDPVKIVEIDGLEITGISTFLSAMETTGTDPVLTACGTTPAIVGADAAGKITIGTGGPTSCTVTFSTAFASAPSCIVTGDNTALGYAATTSTTVLTVTSSADMSTDVISYFCMGL